MYTPPFTFSSKVINLIAEMSAQIERYSIRMEQSDSLRLRKVNRVKTVHSSLAIEGNTLSEGDVTATMAGKTVIAPQRQVLEVKNALKTYKLYSALDPFSIKNLPKARRITLTKGETVLKVKVPPARIENSLSPLYRGTDFSALAETFKTVWGGGVSVNSSTGIRPVLLRIKGTVTE